MLHLSKLTTAFAHVVQYAAISFRCRTDSCRHDASLEPTITADGVLTDGTNEDLQRPSCYSLLLTVASAVWCFAGNTGTYSHNAMCFLIKYRGDVLFAVPEVYVSLYLREWRTWKSCKRCCE